MYNNYPLYYGASIRCVTMTADHAHYTPAIYMKTAAAAKGLSNNQLRVHEPDYPVTLNQIRLDSIETIYNCVLVDKTILTKSRINKLEECLQDELLRSKIIKIF